MVLVSCSLFMCPAVSQAPLNNLLVSCGSFTDNKDGAATRSFTVSQTQKDAIIIGQDTYEVGGDGGKVTINVQHNIDYIMDLSDVNWIVETSTGKTRALETTNIVLEVKKNDSGGPREATVKIINKVSGETSKVTIKQGFNADFSVNAESLSIDERGGMLQILVKANFSVDISFGDTWLSDGGREKVDDLYFWQKVKVDPLTDENNASRTSTVTLSNLTNGQIKVVTVVQTFNPEFSVNTESLSIDERGGTLQVLVKANFTVVTGFGDTWLSDGGREKVDDVLFWQKVNVDSFTEKTTSRTSTMTLANLAYGQYKNVAIVQTHPLFIQAVTVTLKVGDTYPLPLYNESNTAVVWKSANENVATVDMDGKVTGKAVGKTTIKMTSSDGLHKDEVTVTVEQKEEEVPPVESE